jgi:uncharacterized protein (TIGR03083 family)
MDDVDLLATLGEDGAALAAIVATADLDAPVPPCPGWDLGDLARHTGDVHRWVTRVVETGRRPDGESPEGPAAAAALSAWLADGLERLHRVLRDSDPDGPCWTLGFPPERAWFWRRRMALETAVHLGDARTALGQASVVAPGLAAAGLDELADFLYQRQVRLGRTPELGWAVELAASDLDATWRVGPGDAAARVRISGPAVALFLHAWGRVPFDDPTVTIEGTGDDIAVLRAAQLVP